MELNIYYIVYKGQKGARKWIYNKVDITNTFIALHFVNILIKHRQANPYINNYYKR